MVSRRARFSLWWRRSGMGLRVSIFVLGAVLLALLVYWQNPPESSDFLGSNLLVFALVNLNIVVLCILIFLVGRNVVKLVFDRRRKILGSRLRMRLVLAFVLLTLVPMVLLFVTASKLLNRVMEGWFSGQIDTSVSGAVEVARQHYNTLRDGVQRVGKRLAKDIREKPLIYGQGKALDEMLDRERKEYKLFSITLLDAAGNQAARAQNAAAGIETFREPPLDREAAAKALAGEESVLFESREASQFVRAYQPTHWRDAAAALVAAQRFNPKLSQALTKVNDSFKEYERLKLFRGQLRSGYILTLAWITALILFAAVWAGFYMARELSVPIQRLADGTKAVARGDYDFQIRVSGDDEITLLVRSFNKMTADLKLSRREAERRRVYIETILGNLAVGVIALDGELRVTSVNAAAGRFFGINEEARAVGRELRQLLRPADFEQIEPVLGRIRTESGVREGSPGAPIERELNITAGGTARKIICTIGRIIDAQKNRLGTVLLFDDVTDLAKAQQAAAWREVARRIAHEIKNPLTAIQLSAQRLQKMGAARGDAGIAESSQTIVEQTGSIKRLADEFSKFARMPAIEPAPANLNYLIADALSPFAESHPEITFQFIADSHIPEARLDRDQIRRVLINLLDNAIAAAGREAPPGDGGGARITIKSGFDRARGTVSFEVSDNGPGVSASDKNRIFEPYFTTKPGGTGLGLTIVTSIVADHHGDIRVLDNQPHGARFVVELPLSPQFLTQRRFG